MKYSQWIRYFKGYGMIINNIYFDDNFVSMLKKIDIRIQKLFVKKVELFRREPFNN